MTIRKKIALHLLHRAGYTPSQLAMIGGIEEEEIESLLGGRQGYPVEVMAAVRLLGDDGYTISQLALIAGVTEREVRHVLGIARALDDKEQFHFAAPAGDEPVR